MPNFILSIHSSAKHKAETDITGLHTWTNVPLKFTVENKREKELISVLAEYDMKSA